MGIEVCRGQRVFRKAVSVIVAAAFFVNYVLPDAWAARDNRIARRPAPSAQLLTPASLNIDTFKLPVNFGEIRGAYKGSSGKVVIHLQDAHCNYYAQHRIADIIDHLVKEYGVDTVNLEGASGDYDLSVLTSISGDAIRREVSEYFMKKGEVNGAEFYAVNNPKSVKLWGVENKDLYLENLKVYRDSLRTKPEADRYLAQVSAALDELKKKIYSPELLRKDAIYASYKAGDVDFREYISFLADTAKDQGVDMDKFARLKSLLVTMVREKDIDFERANRERDEVVDEASKWLSLNERAEFASRSLEFKTSKISQKAFYDYLMKKAFSLGIGMERFPNLKKYAIYIADYETIDLSKVMDEMGVLETEIDVKLCRNDAQRKLNRLSHDLAIMKNIFSISLTRSDYSYYAANKKDFDMRNFIDFAAKETNGNGKKAVLSEDTLALDGYREKISAFYECSLKRDDAFLENMRFTTAPDGTQIAVIMTGGFHSENLWEIFKASGISYISILPKFTPEEKDYLNPYFDLLAGKDSDMEKMLRSVIARSASLQIASKLSAALGEEVWGKDGIALFRAAVKIEAIVSSGRTAELCDASGKCVFSEGRGPVVNVKLADILAEAGFAARSAPGAEAVKGPVPGTHAPVLPEGRLYNGKADLPVPAVILPLKKIIAPNMPFDDYAVNVAPWVEEMLFFALPLIGSCFLFNGGILAMIISMFSFRLIFLILHSRGEDIVRMDGIEIFALGRRPNMELLKHANTDWRFLEALSEVFIDGFNGPTLNKLRVIAMAHEFEGIFGDERFEAIEKSLVERLDRLGIKYARRDPDAVLNDLEARGESLTDEEKLVARMLDRGAAALRALERRNVYVPWDVRTVIERHDDVPEKDEFMSWPEETRDMFCMFVIAEAFERDNNNHLRDGLKRDPESTLSDIERKFRGSGYMQNYVNGLRSRLGDGEDLRSKVPLRTGEGIEISAADQIRSAIEYSASPITKGEEHLIWGELPGNLLNIVSTPARVAFLGFVLSMPVIIAAAITPNLGVIALSAIFMGLVLGQIHATQNWRSFFTGESPAVIGMPASGAGSLGRGPGGDVVSSGSRDEGKRPGASRGVSGLPNEVYSAAIANAIDKREFVNVKPGRLGDLKDVPLIMDDDSPVSGAVRITDAQMRGLQKAFRDLLSDEEKGSLIDASIVLIPGLDDEVAKEAASRAAAQGRAPPANCYGTHYGITRNQYYLDARLLDSPGELARHLKHEIEECSRVRKLLSEADLATPASERSQELIDRIDELASRAHAGLVVRSLKTGDVIDGWRIERILGRGAMSYVFLVTNVSSLEKGAFKVGGAVSGTAGNAKDGTRLFLEVEIPAAMRLDHGNIPRHMGHGDIDGVPYLVTEYVEGQALSEMIKEGKSIPQEKAVDYAIQLLGALDHASRKQVVHRDIKPANVVITPDGKAYLIDWGLGALDGHDPIFAPRFSVGTPAYMPPEQVSCQREDIDSRSDIYSLGCTLFELLTGMGPFHGDSVIATMYNQLNSVRPSLIRSYPYRGFDPELDRIIGKMIRKAPNDRYLTPAECQNDFKALAQKLARAPVTPAAAAQGPTAALAVSPAPAGPEMEMPFAEPGIARSLIVNYFSGSASWLNWLSRVLGLVTLSTPLHELNHVLAARALGGEANWTWRGLFTGEVSIARGPPAAHEQALKAGMRANLLLSALFGVIAIASSVMLRSDIGTILAGSAALFNLASGLAELLPSGDIGRVAGIEQAERSSDRDVEKGDLAAGRTEADKAVEDAGSLTVKAPISRVLVVDDEELYREIHAKGIGLLNIPGVQVFFADNRQSAINYLRAHPGEIDLLITDRSMPHAGDPKARDLRDHGLALVKEARGGLSLDIPVIFVSGEKMFTPQELAEIGNAAQLNKTLLTAQTMSMALQKVIDKTPLSGEGAPAGKSVLNEQRTLRAAAPAAAILASLIFIGSFLYSFDFDILKFVSYFGGNNIAYAFYFTSCALLGHGVASTIDKDRHWSRYVVWPLVAFLSAFYIFWFVPLVAEIVPDLGLWSHFMRQFVDLFVFGQVLTLGYFSVEALRQKWVLGSAGAADSANLEAPRNVSAAVLEKIRSFYAPSGFAATTALFWMPIGFFTYYGMPDASRLMIISVVSVAFAVIVALFVAQRPGQDLSETQWVNKVLKGVYFIPAVLAPLLAFSLGYPTYALGAIGATIMGYTLFRLWGAFMIRTLPAGEERSSRGVSGLDNAMYSSPIAETIAARGFAAVGLGVDGRLAPGKLTLDSGETAAGKLSLTEAQLKTLNSAKDLLAPEDRALLKDATILFIADLDAKVAKEAARLTPDGRAPPANCYGTHYGIQRRQYYLDANLLLADPEEIARHLRHELRERASVLRGVYSKFSMNEDEIPNISERGANLAAAIEELAGQAHNYLTMDERDIGRLNAVRVDTIDGLITNMTEASRYEEIPLDVDPGEARRRVSRRFELYYESLLEVLARSGIVNGYHIVYPFVGVDVFPARLGPTLGIDRAGDEAMTAGLELVRREFGLVYDVGVYERNYRVVQADALDPASYMNLAGGKRAVIIKGLADYGTSDPGGLGLFFKNLNDNSKAGDRIVILKKKDADAALAPLENLGWRQLAIAISPAQKEALSGAFSMMSRRESGLQFATFLGSAGYFFEVPDELIILEKEGSGELNRITETREAAQGAAPLYGTAPVNPGTISIMIQRQTGWKTGDEIETAYVMAVPASSDGVPGNVRVVTNAQLAVVEEATKLLTSYERGMLDGVQISFIPGLRQPDIAGVPAGSVPYFGTNYGIDDDRLYVEAGLLGDPSKLAVALSHILRERQAVRLELIDHRSEMRSDPWERVPDGTVMSIAKGVRSRMEREDRAEVNVQSMQMIQQQQSPAFAAAAVQYMRGQGLGFVEAAIMLQNNQLAGLQIGENRTLLERNGIAYGQADKATGEITIDIEAAKRAFADIAPELSKEAAYKVTGFVHAHEIFHLLVEKSGVKLEAAEEERLADIFAQKALGLALTAEETKIFDDFVAQVSARWPPAAGIVTQLNTLYESPDFLFNLTKIGLDIYNIQAGDLAKPGALEASVVVSAAAPPVAKPAAVAVSAGGVVAPVGVRIARSVDELPPLKEGYVRSVHITNAGSAEKIAVGGLKYNVFGGLSSTARTWSWEGALDIKYHSEDRRFSFPGAKAVVMDMPMEEHNVHEGRVKDEKRRAGRPPIMASTAPGVVPAKYTVAILDAVPETTAKALAAVQQKLSVVATAPAVAVPAAVSPAPAVVPAPPAKKQPLGMMAAVTDLAKSGREAVGRGEFAKARENFEAAADSFAELLKAMKKGSGESITSRLTRVDIVEWSQAAGIGAGRVFNQSELKDLGQKIRSERELARILTASLMLDSGYYRLGGPDVSGLEGITYGDLSTVDVKNLEPGERVTIGGFTTTASRTFEYSDRATGKAYIVKFLDYRTVTELMGQRWFRLLGFSTPDMRVVNINGALAIIMEKIPGVETLFDYIHRRLVVPRIFNDMMVRDALFPDAFRQDIEDTKLAAITIELKDAHLRNILLRVDENGELLAERPIIIDNERSFGFRVDENVGAGVVYVPYRGAFGKDVIESGRETAILAGEHLFHKGAGVADLTGIAARIGGVTERDIARIVDEAYAAVSEDKRPNIGRDELIDKWMRAIGSVRTIFQVPAVTGDLGPMGGITAAAPSSRGISGLPNVVYSGPIAEAVAARDFAAVGLGADGRLAPGKLTLDSGETAAGKLSLAEAQLKTLNAAKDLLSPEDGKLLNGATILFIPGLDDEVSKEVSARGKTDGRAPPENCYGTHYGIERNQYYLDTRLLDNPAELARHLSHELQERASVIAGLTPEEAATPITARPLELINKINTLASAAHDSLALKTSLEGASLRKPSGEFGPASTRLMALLPVEAARMAREDMAGAMRLIDLVSEELGVNGQNIELGELIGEGYFSSVYADLAGGKAVKAIREEIAFGNDMTKQLTSSLFLLREALILQRLAGTDGVIRQFGVGIARRYYVPDSAGLVLENGGIPLSKIILSGRGKVAPNDIEKLSRRLSKALSAMHERGVWHLDIKPDNILVPMAEDGSFDYDNAVFVDLSLAVDVSRADKKSLNNRKPGLVFGDPHYVPFEGSQNRFTERNDVYGLGMVLYALLTGSPAVTAGGDKRKVYSVKKNMYDAQKVYSREEAAATRLSTIGKLKEAGASEELAAMIADSIWEDADRRLASPAEMTAMLEDKTPSALANVAASLERDLDKLHAKLVASTRPFDIHRMAHIRQVIEMFKQFRRGRPGFEVLYGNINQENRSIVQGTPDKEENLKLYDRAFAVYERLSPKEKDELFIAVTLHDIGFDRTERELDHWGVGADAVGDVLPKYGVSDQTVIKNVSDIIRYHGKIADIGVDVLPGDFSGMSRGLWDSILIVTMMDSAGKLTRKEPFKPDNVLSTRFLSDLFYLHEAGVEMTPEVLLSFRLRSVNVPRAFALSRPGVLLSDEEAASLEEMVRGDMITTEAWSRYIRSYNWPLFLMMRNRKMSVMDIYKVLRLTACVAACRFEKTGVKAPVSFTHAGDDFTDAFYTRVLDSMNGLFSRSPESITVDTVSAELERSNGTGVFGIKVVLDGDKFMLDAPAPAPAAVQQAMPEVPAAILEGKSGMPEGKDITIVAQRPGAWEVRDREGRTLWMKFGGAGEKYAYRLAEMAGVNVPPWRLVALKDISFTGFETEYEGEVSEGGYTPESKVLITRDVNTLRPDELVARGASGLEEMLTFFMWAHAVDVSYVNNTATPVIDGQKRYLTYDIHIDPSETAEYGLDSRIVLSGWQTLDPARMKKAIDRIESLDEKAMQRFAIESGLSENSAKYMSAGLTKRASRLRQYMAEAMRAAAEDERSAAVVLPVRMDGRNITPVFNRYNFLLSVIGESAGDPSSVERKDRAIELINSVWEKLVSEMFSAKNAELFSKILDDEAFARKFALENNPYLGYLYVAVAKEEESMLDKLRDIETNIEQYPAYKNLSPDVRAALSGAIKYGEQYVAKMRARADSFDPQKGFPYKESQLVKKMEGMASSILSTPAAPVAGEAAKAVITAQVEAAKGVISDLRWNVADWVITPEGEDAVSQKTAVDTAAARKFRKDYGSETMIRGYSYDKKSDDKKLSENFTAVLEKVLAEMSDPKFSARKPRAIMYVPADKYELAKQALAAIVQGPTGRVTIIKESEMPANGVVDEVMHVVLGKGLLNAERLRKGDFGSGETLDPAAMDRLIKFLATIAVDLPILSDGSLEPGIIDKILDGIASLKMRPIDFTEIKEWKVAQDEVLRSL